MNICLFGGSFDPPHVKHVEIANDLLDKYDEVWVIVARSSPFKTNHFASFKERFEMCTLAFDNEKIRVLDIEEQLGFKYTYDTVKYLSDKYNYNFSFAIGSDNALYLEKWYKYEQLKKLVNFEVFERTNIYSTVVRVNKQSQIPLIDQYIDEHKLYSSVFQKDYDNLAKVVTKSRFDHSVFVASLCKKLATIHNLDVKKCELAGIYHDYYKDAADYKNFKGESLIDMFKKQYPKYSNFPNPIMHGIIASYKLDLDADILEAIKYHSVGKRNANSILKVLYISDYCEPTRPFASEVAYLLELAYQDLDKAYIEMRKVREEISPSNSKELENFINE